MNKRWNLAETDPVKTEELGKALQIHPVLCRILVQRGIDSFEAAKNYFRPQLSGLHDPRLMKDMDKAVSRILTAIKNNEKILVYGDYDVDGTTAVACMYHFLKKHCSRLEFYIPHRYREGYGVSRAGIDFAKENDCSLIIALDCGIKSHDLVRYARELEIDFIICDHHLPDAELPPATAILNPKQKDCHYPYKELCGCGIGFKLISALIKELDLPSGEAYEYLDLVATAIAADIVPITDENRILAYHGLLKAHENPNWGIKALTQLSGLTRKLHINNLVFMIAPRVNAAGRMDDARKVVQMFIAPAYDEAMSFAELLHSDNADRKVADKTITEEALLMVADKEDWINRKSTVVFQPHWHKGVVGIVASRLIEHYYRPTIVLTKSGEFAAGSARSVPGFNLYEAIHACKDHLLGYGGHFAAAGMTLELEKVDALRERFEEVVSSTILPEQLIPEICIDSEISFDDIKWPFYNILCQMEPFGPGNLRPVFLTRGVLDSGYSKIVKEEHLRVSLRQNKTLMTGIGFRMADKLNLLQKKKPVDIVYKIEENEWNGEKYLQLHLIDLRMSES